MIEFAYTPSSFTIPADTDVSVTLTNSGVTPHNFTIDNPSVVSDDVQAGQSTALTLNLPAGTYEFYCSIPGHRELGMVGTLTVQ